MLRNMNIIWGTGIIFLCTSYQPANNSKLQYTSFRKIMFSAMKISFVKPFYIMTRSFRQLALFGSTFLLKVTPEGKLLRL